MKTQQIGLIVLGVICTTLILTGMAKEACALVFGLGILLFLYKVISID